METTELASLGIPAGAGEAGAAEPTGEGQQGTESAPAAAGGLSADQLARLRGVLVATNPEAVPELIGGGDLDALLASVETARAAFTRVKEAATRSALAAIPRGGGTRALDPAVYAELSPEAKIAFALGGR